MFIEQDNSFSYVCDIEIFIQCPLKYAPSAATHSLQ